MEPFALPIAMQIELSGLTPSLMSFSLKALWEDDFLDIPEPGSMVAGKVSKYEKKKKKMIVHLHRIVLYHAEENTKLVSNEHVGELRCHNLLCSSPKTLNKDWGADVYRQAPP